MIPQVVIHDFHTGLMPLVTALFSTFFPPQDRLLTSEYNEWLYLGNPFGVAKIVSVSDETGWIGFMALIPVVLERYDESLKVYFVVNVLVHPRYFGKNIFGRMIVAAREHVASEGAALMGHPNDMAIKMWQRKKMHFHQPLVPAWVIPIGFGLSLKRYVVDSLDASSPLWDVLKKQRQEAARWQVQLSPQFLTWRFLKHPTNKYSIFWLQADGMAVGVQVTKPMRYPIHLLMDSFVVEPYAMRARLSLPWLTVSMRPHNSSRLTNGFLTLPIKKQMPFFLTNDAQRVDSEDVVSLGLTVSDL